MRTLRGLLPGVALAAVVGLVSLAVAMIGQRIVGHAVVDGLVVAILLGIAVRTVVTLPAVAEAGVEFTARPVLEIAVLLLGASVDLQLLLVAGPALAVGIAVLVVIGIAASYGIGRAVGLPHTLALLVACGNAICGNSAIVAVAPVIGAEKEHVASSIAFTAILGVAVVIGLPFLVRPLALSFYEYGVLAGLTVYAVPQVLAAAFPVSALSGQVGTLVKLVRVLMLGPVVLGLALLHGRRRASRTDASRTDASRTDASRTDARPAFRITQFVPWFIMGFVALAALRSAGFIPDAGVAAMRTLSTWFTIAAMAALGLGVELRAVAKVGRPVVFTVAASLGVLITLSLALIHLLRGDPGP